MGAVIRCSTCGWATDDPSNICSCMWEEAMERLATLAHNLAIAGALCRAFHIGWTSYYERSEVGLSAPFWRPGCRRSAP